MGSKLSRVSVATFAGVSLFACAAVWVGCGGSSAGSGTVPDGGGGVTPEAGPTSEGGTDSGATDSSTKPDAAITGPYLDIQFGSCPALTACGGDPTGLWKVTGGCVDDTVFASAKMQCPTLTVTNPMFQARGTVYADATTIARNTDVKFTATFAIPAACAQPVGSCANVAMAVKLGGLDTATCMDDPAAAGACICDVGSTTLTNTSDTYTTAGNVLTTGTGTSARTFDYCVMASEIKYKETTANTAIPALFTLSK